MNIRSYPTTKNSQIHAKTLRRNRRVISILTMIIEKFDDCITQRTDADSTLLNNPKRNAFSVSKQPQHQMFPRNEMVT